LLGPGSPSRRQAKLIERRYLEAARRLSALLPREQVSLQDLAGGVRRVPLVGGDFHEVSDEEVERLLSVVPPYFWRHMKVPLILRYVKRSDGSGRYEVQGDAWQRRLAELMLTGSYTVSGVSEVSVSEFKRLVARYPSLVFVSLTL